MKFLNKVFNGAPSEVVESTELNPKAPSASVEVIANDFTLTPTGQIANGEPLTSIPAIIRAVDEKTEAPSPAAITPEPDYLDNYEQLRKAMDISGIYNIFKELETISVAVNDLSKSEGKSDDFLETWQPLLTNIEAFTVKRQMLQNIEQQMKQAISELQEIHQKMFDSISAVRAYNKEREIMYAARKKLANELENKLLLLQDPNWINKEKPSNS